MLNREVLRRSLSKITTVVPENEKRRMRGLREQNLISNYEPKSHHIRLSQGLPHLQESA